MIGHFLDEVGANISLVVEVLHGGDPLFMVRGLAKRIGRDEHSLTYEARFLFLDLDRLDADPTVRDQVNARARRLDIKLVPQAPNHEGLLLRHLPGCQTLQPASPRLAEDRLKQEWTEYDKPMTAAELRRRLDHEALLRAAAVEPELDAFLAAIGFFRLVALKHHI